MKADTRSSTIIGVDITVKIRDEIDNVLEEIELLLENGLLSITKKFLGARYNLLQLLTPMAT